MFGALLGVLGMGGNMLQAYGQYEQGRNEQRVANYNAAILNQQARNVSALSDYETQVSTDQARRLKATQTAQYAASGAEITSGTPLLVMLEQEEKMQMDIMQQRRNRAIEAQGLRSQASMLRFEGKQAARAGRIGAVSTILGGVTRAGTTALGMM